MNDNYDIDMFYKCIIGIEFGDFNNIKDITNILSDSDLKEKLLNSNEINNAFSENFEKIFFNISEQVHEYLKDYFNAYSLLFKLDFYNDKLDMKDKTRAFLLTSEIIDKIGQNNNEKETVEFLIILGVNNEYFKELFDKLSIESKKEVLLNLTDSYIKEIINDISDKELLITLFEKYKCCEEISPKLSDEDIEYIVTKGLNKGYDKELLLFLKDDKLKFKLLSYLRDDQAKLEVQKSIKDDDILEKIIETIDTKNKIEIINVLSNDNRKLKYLEILDIEDQISLINGINNKEVQFEAAKMYASKKIKVDNNYDKEKLALLVITFATFYIKNNDLIRIENFEIFSEKYLSTLSEEILSVLASFKDTTNTILNFNEKEYELFYHTLNNYIETNGMKNWREVAEYIIDSIKSQEFKELNESINDFENIDYQKLFILMQNKNEVGIKNVNDLYNVTIIRTSYYDNIVFNDLSSIEDIKNALFQKRFGFGIEQAKRLLEIYGSGVNSLDNSNEKDYIYAIQGVMEIKNIEVLKDIYNKSQDYKLTDVLQVESKIKEQFGKKFNEGILDVSTLKQIKLPEYENLQVFDAGVEFKIILNSSSAFVDKCIKGDYYKDWNRDAKSSEFICTSYIREDMIATAPRHSVCYGFSTLENSSMLQTGVPREFASFNLFSLNHQPPAKFFGPDTLINISNGNNEINYHRIQKGEIKAPDYIVAFKNGSTIENIEEVRKAYHDWNGHLPIILIDINKVLENEKNKVLAMLEEYKQTRKISIGKKILQKVRNNRQTKIDFCNDLENHLTIIREEMKNQDVFEKLLDETKYSTRETVERVKEYYSEEQLKYLMHLPEIEKQRLKDKYSSSKLTDEIMIKTELSEYLRTIIPLINQEYGVLIPQDKLEKLNEMMNNDSVVVINDENNKHDFSADSKNGKVIVNLARIGKSNNMSTPDIFTKIATAKGTLPHELFHIIINMLKLEELADERMVIKLSNGETLTSRGMVGFMLNEGFVEKISQEFCSKYGLYYTIAPQYIPFVNICNYLMQNNPEINLNTIFSLDESDCLNYLSDEQRKQYYEREAISYAVRHKGINVNEIVEAHVEKIQIDFSKVSKERLEEIKKHYEYKNIKLESVLQLDDKSIRK